MRTEWKIAISCCAGFVSGAVGAWLVARKHYISVYEEYIDTIIKHTETEIETKKEDDHDILAKAAINKPDPETLTNEKGYTHYKEFFKSEDAPVVEETPEEEAVTDADAVKAVEINVEMEPQIIPPESFGLEDDYDRITYFWYMDEVLCDEKDNPIKGDITYIVGKDFMNHYGEYEDDAVYIKNDALKLYIEVLKEFQTYEDYRKRNPV